VKEFFLEMTKEQGVTIRDNGLWNIV